MSLIVVIVDMRYVYTEHVIWFLGRLYNKDEKTEAKEKEKEKNVFQKNQAMHNSNVCYI